MSGMILIVGILSLTALLITLLVNTQFSQYVASGYLNGMDDYYHQVAKALEEGSGDDVIDIGTSAVTEGYYVEILSEGGQILYASQNISAITMMGRNVSLLQMKNMPMFSGIEVKSWAIDTGDSEYLLNIGYDTGEGLSEDARRFKNSVYVGILTALIAGVIFSYIGSRIMANPISEEILALKEGARRIQSGQLTHRFETESSVDEISELKQSMNEMAATLLEQEELRKDLVSTVSHEVKTPLTILKSQIDAFVDGIHTPTEDRLIKCKDEIVRLESLMARMEDYDSFSQSSYVLNLSEFSIREEMEALSMILKPQFDKKYLSMALSVEKEGVIRTDRNKLRQIMYNLLSNAYKFSNERTVLQIETAFNEKNLVIDITNQGLVIDDQDQRAIFDPRYRAGNANSKDPYGKGLGLHISRGLVEFLDGSLQLIKSSEEETVFRLILFDVYVQEGLNYE